MKVRFTKHYGTAFTGVLLVLGFCPCVSALSPKPQVTPYRHKKVISLYHDFLVSVLWNEDMEGVSVELRRPTSSQVIHAVKLPKVQLCPSEFSYSQFKTSSTWLFIATDRNTQYGNSVLFSVNTRTKKITLLEHMPMARIYGSARDLRRGRVSQGAIGHVRFGGAELLPSDEWKRRVFWTRSGQFSPKNRVIWQPWKQFQ